MQHLRKLSTLVKDNQVSKQIEINTRKKQTARIRQQKETWRWQTDQKQLRKKWLEQQRQQQHHRQRVIKDKITTKHRIEKLERKVMRSLHNVSSTKTIGVVKQVRQEHKPRKQQLPKVHNKQRTKSKSNNKRMTNQTSALATKAEKKYDDNDDDVVVDPNIAYEENKQTRTTIMQQIREQALGTAIFEMIDDQ